jgi:large subunit ribosomal protein L13
MKQHTIDATGKKIGRVATEAASFLMGKDSTKFVKNAVADVKVEITNTSKADIISRKQDSKTYTWYTGFRGGLKNETMSKLIERKGFGEVFKTAVYRMLPPNSLRKKIMKNLTVSE